MYDCHMHMILDGYDWKRAIARHQGGPDEAWIHSVLKTYADLGFTYLRDGGDRWGAGKKARELAPAYGITYRTPLAPLCKKGHYGSFIGKSYEDLREYTALVKQARADGADFIKLMISGLMDFDRFGVLTEGSYPEMEIRELIHIAHEEGFAVMAHANGGLCMEFAAKWGVDTIEHGAYATENALRAMKENGVIWCPTLSTVANLRGKGRFREESVRDILADTCEKVQKFVQMGGTVAPGTDAGAWSVPHGSLSEYVILGDIIGEEALRQGAEGIKQRF